MAKLALFAVVAEQALFVAVAEMALFAVMDCGLTLSLVSWVLLIAVLGFQNILKPTKNDN